jgi:hypothetical protein
MGIYEEIDAEVLRAHMKHGDQSALPDQGDFDPGFIGEDSARTICDRAFEEGQGSWSVVALEEFAEVTSAPDDAARREELVQLAAVAVRWIQAIDARS